MKRQRKAELDAMLGKPPHPRRRPSRAVTAVATLAVLAAAVVSAATYHREPSSSTVVTKPAAAVRSAATSAAKASSLHLDLTIKISGPLNVTEHMVGDIDAEHHLVRMVLTAPHVRLEMINTTKAAYVRSGSTGPWTEVTLAPSIAAKLRSQLNPAAGELALLQRLGSPVTNEGPATIDGVPTTHYRTKLDWKKLFTVTTNGGLASEGQLGQLEGAVSKGTGSVDAYLDSQQRLRAAHYTLALTIEGQTMRVQADAAYSHYGEAVQIAVPTAGQVSATRHADTAQDLEAVVAELAVDGATTPA